MVKVVSFSHKINACLYLYIIVVVIIFLYMFVTILSAFAKFLKATLSFDMSVCPSVRPH